MVLVALFEKWNPYIAQNINNKQKKLETLAFTYHYRHRCVSKYAENNYCFNIIFVINSLLFCYTKNSIFRKYTVTLAVL